VFQPLDGRRHAELAPPEIDDAIGALVPAAPPAHGDAAGIVAPAGRGLALDQALHGLALVELRPIDQDELALSRGRRLVGSQRHDNPALTNRSSRRSTGPRRG